MAAVTIGDKLDSMLGTNAYQSPSAANTIGAKTMNTISSGAKSLASDYLGMRLHHVPVDMNTLAQNALGAGLGHVAEDKTSELFAQHVTPPSQQHYQKAKQQAKAMASTSTSAHSTASSHAASSSASILCDIDRS